MGWSHGRDPHQTALGVPVRVPQRKMRPLPRADLPPPLGPLRTGFWGTTSQVGALRAPIPKILT